MEQKTTLASREDLLAACLKQVALWYQSLIEPSSKRHDLAPIFEKVLLEIFLKKEQPIRRLSMYRSLRFEDSSTEFQSFFQTLSKETNLEFEWFPISHVHINIERFNLVDVCLGEQNNDPRPIYTVNDFELNQN